MGKIRVSLGKLKNCLITRAFITIYEILDSFYSE
jgi:hypothetical protein